MLIFVVALIVFGPKRLPEIGKTLGKALGEFKKATDDLKSSIEREVRIDELKQISPSLTVPPTATVSRAEPPAAAPGDRELLEARRRLEEATPQAATQPHDSTDPVAE
jgi:TatA/E family protein of Tat protein translocase